MLGLYIHVPFCAVKCDYCDFYSMRYSRKTAYKYANETARRISLLDGPFDTVYFGGGTPSLIGADNIAHMMNSIGNRSNIVEATVECNPRSYAPEFFEKIAKCGINRISVGLQSAVQSELKALSRRHSPQDVADTVCHAKSAGISNISVDIMLGIPGQTEETLKKSLDYAVSLDVRHISAYMLIIEENTPFYTASLKNLPDDDQTAQMYLFMVDYLRSAGYIQYEISNFARAGYESRHNLIYWTLDEYIGLGPAAHSYYHGERRFFPRDMQYYLDGGESIFDCNGGTFEEYVMLALRLCKGISFDDAKAHGYVFEDDFLIKCAKFSDAGLLFIDDCGIRLTPEGFLVQNQILTELL